MFPEESRGRQKKLGNLIYELSKELLDENEDQIKQFLNRLKVIYKDDFKHKYSDFFPILMEIYKDDNEYNIDYLSNNLDMLETYLEDEYPKGEGEYDGIYAQFTKLCDHLNLQIGQFSYLLSQNSAVDLLEESNRNLQASMQKVAEVSIKLDDSYENLKTTNANLEEANRKADTIQTELIAMLSIFAAIVIAFSGGITLLGNSISAISDAKHYESVILAAIICGIVMFNTIFLLMYFVSKLTKRNINVSCEAEVCMACNNKKCKWLSKIKKRYPYVFYYNCLSIAGILIDLGVWVMHMKGYIG